MGGREGIGQGKGAEAFHDGVRVADAMDLGNVTIRRGDIVLSGREAGVVQLCAEEEDGSLACVAQLLVFESELSQWGARWRATDRLTIFDASDCVVARAFKHVGPDVLELVKF